MRKRNFVKRRRKGGCTKSAVGFSAFTWTYWISLTTMTSCRCDLFFNPPGHCLRQFSSRGGIPHRDENNGFTSTTSFPNICEESLEKRAVPDPWTCTSRRAVSFLLCGPVYLWSLRLIYHLCDIWIPICYVGIQYFKLFCQPEPEDLPKGLSRLFCISLHWQRSLRQILRFTILCKQQKTTIRMSACIISQI